MNERISALKEYIVSKKHLTFRHEKLIDQSAYQTGEFHRRVALRLKMSLEAQDIVFLPNERFIATRTMKSLPPILTKEEQETLSKQYSRVFNVNNICPDYSQVIAEGIIETIKKIESSKEKNPEKTDYLDSCIIACQSIIDFSQRYKLAAEKLGLFDIAKNLSRIPQKGATTFYEALQFFRFLHFALWCEGENHIVVGRFDQYMLPYLQSDMEKGILNEESALELLEDFFLSFNKDTDLYPGVQLGDNGQSMVLGGYDENGNDQYNILSKLCLEASLQLKVIDPKINLRVNSKTPLERYMYASHLTATGIGFPQYSNDDIVVKGLTNLGYSYSDAVNYVVAACWEFIIPRKGNEIVNIGTLQFARCVDNVVKAGTAKTYNKFLKEICCEIENQAKQICNQLKSVVFIPAPLMSVLMEDCIEKGFDISEGCIYNNFGIHGAGIATAADYAIAIKYLVYDGDLTMQSLVEMLDKNYEGYEDIRNKILNEIPKMGNNCDEVDSLGVLFLKAFADSLEGIENCRGGKYRAGTGTALSYIAKDLRATADGRKNGDYLPANYSPSLNVKLDGPFSIIQSFVKPELSHTINGGPLTLEFNNSSLKNNIDKLALLVKSFIDLGGHQLQLNVIHKENLMKAQVQPELYRNLVVRVWGWSGYFTELDKIFQDQIICRSDWSL